MKNLMLFILGISIFIFPQCQPRKIISSQEWKIIAQDFKQGFEALELVPNQISYVANLKAIKDEKSVLKQEHFFNRITIQLQNINPKKLTASDRLDFDLIQYETRMNLQRIELEKQWYANKPKTISDGGLYTLPNGKNWYLYFLKRWIDDVVTPDEIYTFGLGEIERVKARMKTVQKRSGMDSLVFQNHIDDVSFFYTDVEVVQKEFEKIKATVAKKLPEYFPQLESIPDVKIEKGTNEALAQVPAFYRSQSSTFFYNYFDKPFNKRQISWIYIHEAMPGHHYQIKLENSLERSDIQKMFRYSCYREGWAAYIEEIGYEIGAYRDIYDELGKWEWDIIRSVRISLDVGLNYYGWDDDKALAFWKQHIQGQDDIGLREIARMKRWPCQVITYKYGADKILKWKAIFENKKTGHLKDFHQQILEQGSLPFSILEKILNF